MKIWLKTFIGDKIVKQVTAPIPDAFSADTLFSLLQDVLLPIDLPTPAVLGSHAEHLAKFGITKFLPRDFVERVDFDRMSAEIVLDSGEKREHKRTPLDEA